MHFRATRSIRFVATLISLALPTVPSLAQDTFRGIVLPSQLGTLQRGKVTNNEMTSPGMGVTVAYGAPGIKATVFIYDLGVPNLQGDAQSRVLREHAEQSVRDVLQVNSDVEIVEPLQPATGDCGKFLRAKMKYKERNDVTRELLESHLYLGIHRGQYLKVRFTYPTRIAFSSGVVAEARFAAAFCRAALD
jgi:hypothetical protein